MEKDGGKYTTAPYTPGTKRRLGVYGRLGGYLLLSRDHIPKQPNSDEALVVLGCGREIRYVVCYPLPVSIHDIINPGKRRWNVAAGIIMSCIEGA